MSFSLRSKFTTWLAALAVLAAPAPAPLITTPAAIAVAAIAAVAPGQAEAGPFTDYSENKFSDWLFRGQTFTPPATIYIALIAANRGFWTASTAYVTNDYVLPATPNGRLYKAAGNCTSGASAPTWGTTAGGSTTDNTCSWTEQTTALEAGSFPEVSTSGTGYARVSVASSLANWSGTQGAGTTVASSGTGGTISNNNVLTFGSGATASWSVIFGFTFMDASSGGNALIYQALTTPQTVNNGAPAPYFSAGAITVQFDN